MKGKSIQDYFLAEMQLLNERMQSFAERHPKRATEMGIDSLSDRDPHIERLLEGSAYLQGRVKQQVDLGVHHVSEALLRQVAPQYLAPRPSQCIVEFSSPRSPLSERETIPAGVKLFSDAVGEEQTRCEFRTLQATTIQPVQLLKIENDAIDKSSLCLKLALNEGVSPGSIQLDQLTFFIDVNPPLASLWYYYFTKNVMEINLHQDEKTRRLGGQQQVKGINWLDYDSPLPITGAHTKAFSLLDDYSRFPERFLFIRLQLPELSLCKSSFEITIKFNKHLPSYREKTPFLKLHCVPAINLFSSQCDPIRYHKNQSRYPLILDHSKPASQCLFAVTQVNGIKKHNSEVTKLKDYFAGAHLSEKNAYYRFSQIKELPDFMISHLTFSGDLDDDMYMSCDALACNGYYPREYLRPGTLFLKDEALSTQLQATNITQPSRYHHPIFDSRYAVRVLSGVHAQFNQLENVAYIKYLMHFHDEFNQLTQEIEALKAVQFKPFNHLSAGMVKRGITCKITIQKNSYHALADLHFLGCILHHFLRSYAPINTRLETIMQIVPTGEQLYWPYNG